MAGVVDVCFMACEVSICVKPEFHSLTAGTVAMALLAEDTAW